MQSSGWRISICVLSEPAEAPKTKTKQRRKKKKKEKREKRQGKKIS